MSYYFIHYTPNQKVITKKYDAYSEALRAEARLARNLGDLDMAQKWDRQAELEEEYEKGQQQ